MQLQLYIHIAYCVWFMLYDIYFLFIMFIIYYNSNQINERKGKCILLNRLQKIQTFHKYYSYNAKRLKYDTIIDIDY
jgi:hypothetical protein